MKYPKIIKEFSGKEVAGPNFKNYQEAYDSLTWETHSRELDWFDDEHINIAHVALDAHIKSGREDKAAMIWESKKGIVETFTFRDMYRLSNQFANVLVKEDPDDLSYEELMAEASESFDIAKTHREDHAIMHYTSGTTGKPDPIAMEVVKAFVSLKAGYEPSDELRHDIKKFVMKRLSSAASPREIDFIPSLPKTRSGKIMRRLLKAKELGLPLGDTSTLEDD